MKFKNYIAAFLSIYMLALILMPCNDTCDAREHNTPIALQTPDDHHEQDNDFCSPFCTCACCSIHVTVTNFMEFKAFAQTEANVFSLFKQSFFSVFSDDCWQPPRLA